MSALDVFAVSLALQTVTIEGPVLWRTLREGMTAEEAAVALRRMPGIKKVVVKGKPLKPRLSISYTGAGLPVADWNVTLSTDFANARLASITLNQSGCYSLMQAKIQKLLPVLKQKYPNSAEEKVVDSNGVFIENRLALWDNQTRVRIFANVKLPGAAPAYNNLSRIGTALALAACPNDELGATADVGVNYSSEAAFLIEQSTSEKKDYADSAKAKDAF